MEVFASNGAKIISVTDRVTRSSTSGTTASISNGSYLDTSITGLTTADDWQVLTAAISPPQGQAAFDTVTTTSNGSFRIANNMGVTSAYDYIIIRSG